MVVTFLELEYLINLLIRLKLSLSKELISICTWTVLLLKTLFLYTPETILKKLNN